MRNLVKKTRWLLVSTLTCVLLTGLLGSTWETAIAALPTSPTATLSANNFLGQADVNVQQAEAVLVAQGSSPSALTSYVAVMSKNNVVPGDPKTMARGAVGAAMSGNRLIVRGSFRNLSSPPRDYASDPVDPPNNNITSAFHIHQGTPDENGPFQYALDVTLNDANRGGSAEGEYTLTPEQAQALADGRLYVDIHTTQNRGGELRGILMPY